MVREIRDYIEYYIKSKDAGEVINSSDIVNKDGFDVWSFKKLIFLEYYIKPFLYILENNNFKCVFIDFFSSCGANKLIEEHVNSLGSAIISLLRGVVPNKKRGKNNRFYKWFFVDHDELFCEALEKRVLKTLKIVKERYNEELILNKDVLILCGDCNKKIDEIIEGLKKEVENEKIAILAFIDPYTFTNIEWETWKKLFSLRFVDIIFTFPIQTIERGYKRCKELHKYLSASINNLINKYKDISKIPEQDFERAYAKDISELVNRSIAHYDEGISVKSLENREIYRIELFTHCTAALKAVLPKAKELDKIDSKNFKEIVKQVCGKQKSIKDFS